MLFTNVVHDVPICGGLMLLKQHLTRYCDIMVNTKLIHSLLKNVQIQQAANQQQIKTKRF